MEIFTKSCLAAALLIAWCGICTADVVYLGEGGLAAGQQGLDVPDRWMTKEEVEQKHGSPLSRSEPVGDPPISFWRYDQYTVFFERNRVLHTVTNVARK